MWHVRGSHHRLDSAPLVGSKHEPNRTLMRKALLSYAQHIPYGSGPGPLFSILVELHRTKGRSPTNLLGATSRLCSTNRFHHHGEICLSSRVWHAKAGGPNSGLSYSHPPVVVRWYGYSELPAVVKSSRSNATKGLTVVLFFIVTFFVVGAIFTKGDTSLDKYTKNHTSTAIRPAFNSLLGGFITRSINSSTCLCRCVCIPES